MDLAIVERQFDFGSDAESVSDSVIHGESEFATESICDGGVFRKCIFRLKKAVVGAEVETEAQFARRAVVDVLSTRKNTAAADCSREKRFVHG